MSEFVELHCAPLVGEALASLGWEPSHPLVRTAVPTAARGNNLVVSAPPSAAWAGPALGGILSHLLATSNRRALLLAPLPALETWAGIVEHLARGSDLRPVLATTPARATRHLKDGSVDLLLTTPETAAELHRRSALQPEGLAAVVLAWPESWASVEMLPDLMQDVPHETQRVVVTGAPAQTADLVERYVWRAAVAQPTGEAPENDAPSAGASNSIRVVTTPWHRRMSAIGEILELLDPARVAVWAADRSSAPTLAALLAGRGSVGGLVVGDGPLGEVDLIIAFDLPESHRLAQWPVPSVLLTPPGTETYVRRIAPSRRPLPLPGAVDAARAESAERRATIVAALKDNLEDDLLAIAPLLEAWEAPLVAAALHRLWRVAQEAVPAVALPVGPAAAGTGVKLWIGAGRKDDATPADLVGMLTKELGLDRTVIGKIDVRETFTLLELHGGDPAQVAEQLTGKTIRRRRLVARVDQGPRAGGPDRSAGGRPGGRPRSPRA